MQPLRAPAGYRKMTFTSAARRIWPPKGERGRHVLVSLCSLIILAGAVFCWKIAAAQNSPQPARLAIVGPAGSAEFARRLSDDPALRKLGLELEVKRYDDSSRVIKDLKAGVVQIAMFNLDTLVNQEEQSRSPLAVASALSQPFQFRSDEELADVLSTSFGESVLADVSRAGIVPLSLWNQGLSQIVSEKSNNKSTFFVGSHVMTSSAASWHALKALGADASLSREGYVDWYGAKYKDVDAIETAWDLPADISNRIKPRTFVLAFRPLIQVVAANRGFWNNLSETQKKTVASEVLAITKQADIIALQRNEAGRKRLETNATFVNYTDQELIKLRDQSSPPNSNSEPEWRIQILDRAKAEAAASKKK
jgi:TRAP-type C4-dicarboxylate transport system substrate-binding protein